MTLSDDTQYKVHNDQLRLEVGVKNWINEVEACTFIETNAVPNDR